MMMMMCSNYKFILHAECCCCCSCSTTVITLFVAASFGCFAWSFLHFYAISRVVSRVGWRGWPCFTTVSLCVHAHLMVMSPVWSSFFCDLVVLVWMCFYSNLKIFPCCHVPDTCLPRPHPQNSNSCPFLPPESLTLVYSWLVWFLFVFMTQDCLMTRLSVCLCVWVYLVHYIVVGLDSWLNYFNGLEGPTSCASRWNYDWK